MTAHLTAARRRWPSAVWITGNGPWASVSHCGGDTTVMLFDTMTEADKARVSIDRTGCDHACRQWQHQVVHLSEAPT